MANAEGGAAELHLTLYGRVSWRCHGRSTPVASGKPLRLLLMLVEQHPHPVSVDAIVDRIWGDEPPRSVANAVQRHVSRLRADLRTFDSIDPATVIESVSVGYRLGRHVSTDLDQMDALLDDSPAMLDPTNSSAPHWWHEPLVSLPAGHSVELRTRLERLARDGAHRWARHAQREREHERVVAVLSQAQSFHPFDEAIAVMIAESALQLDDMVLVRHQLDRAAQIAADLGVRPASDLTELRKSATSHRGGLVTGLGGTESARIVADCGERWIAGDLDAARRYIDEHADVVDVQLATRVRRWLRWLAFDDPNACTLWTQMIGLRTRLPEQAERALVSLDSYALEHCADGSAIAQDELDAARTPDEVVRALRVRFMIGLANPLDPAQDAIVGRLASDPSADAQVEASRFAAFLATKRGDFEAAVEQFAETERRARRLWNSVDDLAVISIAVLAIHNPDLADLGPRAGSFPEVATDRLTFDIARTWRTLTASDLADPLEPMFSAAVGAMPKAASDSFKLLRDLRAEDAAATRDEAHRLASVLPSMPRTRYLHATIAALAHWTVQANDRDVAMVVTQAAQPWSGEYLGIWPLHTLLGRADDTVGLVDTAARAGGTRSADITASLTSG